MVSATVPAAVGKISVTAPAMSLTIVDLAAFKARQRARHRSKDAAAGTAAVSAMTGSTRLASSWSSPTSPLIVASPASGSAWTPASAPAASPVASSATSSAAGVSVGSSGSAVLTVAAGATSAFAPANSSRRADASAAHASGATTGPPLPPPPPSQASGSLSASASASDWAAAVITGTWGATVVVVTSGVTAISGAVPSSEPVASTSPIDSGADRGPLSVSRGGGSGASADDGIPAVAGTSVFRAWVFSAAALDRAPPARRPGFVGPVPSSPPSAAGLLVGTSGATEVPGPRSGRLRRLPARDLAGAGRRFPVRLDSSPADPAVSPRPASAAAVPAKPRIAVPTPRATASAPTRPTWYAERAAGVTGRLGG